MDKRAAKILVGKLVANFGERSASRADLTRTELEGFRCAICAEVAVEQINAEDDRYPTKKRLVRALLDAEAREHGRHLYSDTERGDRLQRLEAWWRNDAPRIIRESTGWDLEVARGCAAMMWSSGTILSEIGLDGLEELERLLREDLERGSVAWNEVLERNVWIATVPDTIETLSSRLGISPRKLVDRIYARARKRVVSGEDSWTDDDRELRTATDADPVLVGN